MEITFIGQGFAAGSSVGNLLFSALQDEAFEEFKALSAFVGVGLQELLADTLNKAKTHLTDVALVVGVDEQGTSKEALEGLLGLGMPIGVFYTPSPAIFHPKLYLLAGPTKCLLIVGSANFTRRGLFQNIEAAVALAFERGDEEGERTLSQVRTYYQPLFKGSHSNVQPLTADLIAYLFTAGIIPDTAMQQAQRKSRGHVGTQAADVPAVKDVLAQLFPALPSLPSLFKKQTRKKTAKEGSVLPVESTFPAGKSNLVWTR